MQLALLASAAKIGRKYFDLDAVGREIYREKSFGRKKKAFFFACFDEEGQS
jgi:hypothetical protein